MPSRSTPRTRKSSKQSNSSSGRGTRSRSTGTRSRSRSSSGSRSSRSRTTGRSNRTSRSSRQGGRRPSGIRRNLSNVEPNVQQVEELILQCVETEKGGVQVYTAAIECAVNEDLKEEWQEYLEQTRHHVEVVEELCQKCGIDADKQTPGREAVRMIGETLVNTIQSAQQAGEPEAAELVAAECVTLAETKDHLNWALLSEVAKTSFDWAEAIQDACDEVEDEEDEHLYHTMGWTRELWIQSFGLPAALPPPEEEKDVKSMAAAAKAKAQRKQYVEAES